MKKEMVIEVKFKIFNRNFTDDDHNGCHWDRNNRPTVW